MTDEPQKRGPGRPRKNPEAPTRITEPAVDPAQPVAEPAADPTQDAIIEPATTDNVVLALIESLGVDPRNVAGLEIRPQGMIRILGVDRSARSVRFTPLPRYQRAADGRIIA